MAKLRLLREPQSRMPWASPADEPPTKKLTMLYSARYHDSALDRTASEDGLKRQKERQDGSFLFLADSSEEAPKKAEEYRQGRPGGHSLSILAIQEINNGR
jgi:hypothetical protein